MSASDGGSDSRMGNEVSCGRCFNSGSQSRCFKSYLQIKVFLSFFILLLDIDAASSGMIQYRG